MADRALSWPAAIEGSQGAAYVLFTSFMPNSKQPEQILLTRDGAPLTDPILGLPSQAVRGSFWTYVAFASGKALSFVTTVILARLLVPEEFGLVGYCLVALQYLALVNLFGMDQALISRRDKL